MKDTGSKKLQFCISLRKPEVKQCIGGSESLQGGLGPTCDTVKVKQWRPVLIRGSAAEIRCHNQATQGAKGLFQLTTPPAYTTAWLKHGRNLEAGTEGGVPEEYCLQVCCLGLSQKATLSLYCPGWHCPNELGPLPSITNQENASEAFLQINLLGHFFFFQLGFSLSQWL